MLQPSVGGTAGHGPIGGVAFPGGRLPGGGLPARRSVQRATRALLAHPSGPTMAIPAAAIRAVDCQTVDCTQAEPPWRPGGFLCGALMARRSGLRLPSPLGRTYEGVCRHCRPT